MSEENENLRAADPERNNTDETPENLPAENGSGAADRLHVYRRSILWITVITLAVRLVALFTAYDTGIGYFNRNNIFPVVSDALLALGGLLAISSIIVFRRRNDMTVSPAFSGGAEFFTALYAGFIFIADAAYKVYTFVGLYRSGELENILDKFKNPKYYQGPADKITRILAIVAVIGFVSAILAAVYFLRGGGVKNKKGQTALGYFVIIRCLCGIARVYFNMEIPMNNPGKLLCEISLMSVMLYFLAEARLNIGGERAKPNLFIGSGLAAFLFCTVAGITSVIGLFTGVAPYGEYCVEGIVAIVCAFYIFVRLSAYERIVRYATVDAPATVGQNTDPAPDDSNN